MIYNTGLMRLLGHGKLAVMIHNALFGKAIAGWLSHPIRSLYFWFLGMIIGNRPVACNMVVHRPEGFTGALMSFPAPLDPAPFIGGCHLYGEVDWHGKADGALLTPVKK